MREQHSAYDDYGIDPLRDTKFASISSISDYTPHTVTEFEKYNPQALADAYYSDPELYFVILYYNGLGNGFDMTSGLTLKIPSPESVRNLFSTQNNKAPRKVTL